MPRNALDEASSSENGNWVTSFSVMVLHFFCFVGVLSEFKGQRRYHGSGDVHSLHRYKNLLDDSHRLEKHGWSDGDDINTAQQCIDAVIDRTMICE